MDKKIIAIVLPALMGVPEREFLDAQEKIHSAVKECRNFGATEDRIVRELLTEQTVRLIPHMIDKTEVLDPFFKKIDTANSAVTAPVRLMLVGHLAENRTFAEEKRVAVIEAILKGDYFLDYEEWIDQRLFPGKPRPKPKDTKSMGLIVGDNIRFSKYPSFSAFIKECEKYVSKSGA